MSDNSGAADVRDFLERIDWVRFVAFALIGAFVVTLFTLYFFPIYPDEIQVRFWLSRLPYDFPLKISGAPTCLSTFCQTIPTTMYLPSVVNWLIHGTIGTAPGLRVVGIVFALIWVGALIVYLNYRADISKTAQQRVFISGFCIALFTVGVFPVFIITNRNEQLLLPSLAVLIGVYIFSRQLQNNGRTWQKVGVIIVYFMAISLVLFSHAKGLFFTPLFIIVGWQVFKKPYGLIVFLSAMILVGFHVAQDYFAWTNTFKCPEVPRLMALFKSFSFDPLLIFSDTRSFFDQAYNSITWFKKYLHQIGFQRYTDIAYLPSFRVKPLAQIANIFIKFNFALMFLALLAFLPFQYLKNDILKGRIVTINSALIVLLICGLISAVFNLPKNWYDAGFVYALLLIILVFFVGENFPDVFRKRITRIFFVYVGLVSLLSQGVFISRNLPAFLNGYAGPSVSIVKWNSEKMQADIIAASQTCSIDIVGGKKLVVDDYTYLYLRKTKWPMPITYIWAENNDKSIREFFSTVGSDGLIVNCTAMLSPYLSVVRREGDVCCIPKNELANLASLP